MSKILAVFGATGHQGSSVISHVLSDPGLFQQYKIRAITRDVNSEKAKQLKATVEVVQGDVLDRVSLGAALAGAHTVFAMTAAGFGPDALEVEYSSGKAIADVAVEQAVEFIIFSTLPSVKDISGGKYTKIAAFDAKAMVEQHIRGLPIRSAFYSPGSFMENFLTIPILRKQQPPDGTWVIALPSSSKTPMALLDAAGDTGKFIGAILAEPDKYDGKTLCAATGIYTMEEVVAIMSKVTGKTVVCKQIPLGEFKAGLQFGADLLADLFSYYDEFGYFGPDSEKLVAWAAGRARGKLSTLEEFLVAHSFKLE